MNANNVKKAFSLLSITLLLAAVVTRISGYVVLAAALGCVVFKLHSLIYIGLFLSCQIIGIPIYFTIILPALFMTRMSDPTRFAIMFCLIVLTLTLEIPGPKGVKLGELVMRESQAMSLPEEQEHQRFRRLTYQCITKGGSWTIHRTIQGFRRFYYCFLTYKPGICYDMRHNSEKKSCYHKGAMKYATPVGKLVMGTLECL